MISLARSLDGLAQSKPPFYIGTLVAVVILEFSKGIGTARCDLSVLEVSI